MSLLRLVSRVTFWWATRNDRGSIVMFVGRNGFGKTAALVELGVIPSWRVGRRVVSNISLYPEELGLSPDLYQPLNEPLLELPRLGRHVRRVCVVCQAQVRFDRCRVCGEPSVTLPRMHPDGGLWSITANQGCGLVLDEIVTMFPSRDSVSLPPELQRLLNQFRKPDISPVLISCPDWKRADIMIRETVQAVVESRPAFPWLQKLLGVSRPPQGQWGWWSHGWFERLWFDPESYEKADESVNAAAQLFPYKRKRSLSKATRMAVRAAYDTQEGVELADHLSCVVCGGKTGRGTCKDAEGHRAAAREARRQQLGDYLTAQVLEHADLIVEAAQLDAAQALRLLELGPPSRETAP